MSKLNLFVCLALMNSLLGCRKDEQGADGNTISLVGTAVNLKLGAGVISNEVVYYLDGVQSWDEANLERKIQVNGELYVEILPPLPPRDTTIVPPPPPPARVSDGFMLIIKNPKW